MQALTFPPFGTWRLKLTIVQSSFSKQLRRHAMWWTVKPPVETPPTFPRFTMIHLYTQVAPVLSDFDSSGFVRCRLSVEMSAAVDGNFSATQGLAKVFAQAGAIDQGFSQAFRELQALCQDQHTLCNHESKVVFWPFAKKVESSTAKAYKVLSVWLHYVDSPIPLTPGSHCVRRSRRRQWRYERSFSAFECCPKCVITSLGMWSNQAMERIPTLRAFELVILTKWWPWVRRWTDAKFWVNFLRNFPVQTFWVSIVNPSWSNGLNRALLGMCQASPHLLESLVMDSVGEEDYPLWLVQNCEDCGIDTFWQAEHGSSVLPQMSQKDWLSRDGQKSNMRVHGFFSKNDPKPYRSDSYEILR